MVRYARPVSNFLENLRHSQNFIFGTSWVLYDAKTLTRAIWMKVRRVREIPSDFSGPEVSVTKTNSLWNPFINYLIIRIWWSNFHNFHQNAHNFFSEGIGRKKCRSKNCQKLCLIHFRHLENVSARSGRPKSKKRKKIMKIDENNQIRKSECILLPGTPL